MNIPKDTSNDSLPAQGTWRPSKRGGVKTAMFHCPNCPTVGSLAETHNIADDGTVTPSMVCPNCDYHEWIKLDSWNEITLGQLAYEAAAKVTGCDQHWKDANQIKWEAVANAVKNSITVESA